MIKLLPKSSLQEQKAREKMREISEGAKLASRVDGLRETYSKVEQDLEKYRTATLEAIGKEIKDLDEKKNVLSDEIKVMQRKYDRMMPEISTKRTELAQFEKSLKAWEKKLEKKDESSELMELDVMEAKQKAELSLSVQQDNERITANLLMQADKKRNEAQKTLEIAKTIQEKAHSDKKDIEAEINLREFSIKSKETELSNMELKLITDRKALEVEKVQVADQRATLARAMQRLKEGRHA